MRRLLFIDKFDGSLPLSNNDYMLNCLRYITEFFLEASADFKIHQETKHTYNLEVNMSVMQKIKDKYDLNISTMNAIVRSIMDDEYTRIFCEAFRGFKSNKNRGYYIVSKNLCNFISNIKLDIKMKCLPSDYAGYFELEGLGLKDIDGTDIVCGFVTVSPWIDKMLIIALITTIFDNGVKTYQLRTFNIPYREESTFEEMYQEYVVQSTNPKINRDGIIHEVYDHFQDCPYIQTLLNMALYSVNPNEELFLQHNDFSNKKNKKQTQEKIYTKKGFYELGFKDSQFLKLIAKGSTVVSAYWRSQPYGPGNSLRRPQLIASHERVYSKYLSE